MESEPPLNWLAGPVPAGLFSQARSVRETDGVTGIALMADAHPGPVTPNGMVTVSERFVFPAFVGSDIGCGYSAIRFPRESRFPQGKIDDSLRKAIRLAVPTLSSADTVSGLPDAVPAAGLSSPKLAREAERTARPQLGTLGRGNHFIELDIDPGGDLWLLVHSGSRGIGQAISNYHMKQDAGTESRAYRGLDVLSDAGASYMNDMAWAVAYARENRLRIVNVLLDLLERELDATVDESSWIDCPHNFARIETHGGRKVVVHRKSANSAAMGEAGIIAGTMASGACIVRGMGEATSFSSSSHGAGRLMCRTEARRAVSSRRMVREMRGIVFDEASASLLRDEAPEAYRNIDEVMRAQKGLVRIVLRLRPVLNDKRN